MGLHTCVDDDSKGATGFESKKYCNLLVFNGPQGTPLLVISIASTIREGIDSLAARGVFLGLSWGGQREI